MTTATDATMDWLEKFVIGLKLCPFATLPFRQHRIRYVEIPAMDIAQQLEQVGKEMQWLAQQSPSETETTLLIFPDSLQDFTEFLDVAYLSETLLASLGLTGVLQVATFHPHYQFDGTTPDDPTNRTNQSPYPILHLIREESITKAVENFPNVEAVPERNKALMRELFGQ